MPMQEEVEEGRMRGKNFLVEEEVLLFVSLRKVENEVKRQGHMLSLLETCNYLKSGMTRS